MYRETLCNGLVVKDKVRACQNSKDANDYHSRLTTSHEFCPQLGRYLKKLIKLKVIPKGIFEGFQGCGVPKWPLSHYSDHSFNVF